jgi:hypothetical protein
MSNSKTLSALALLLAALAVGPAAAATVWDEAIDGDLSGDRTAPTPLVFSTGDNDVFGTMGRPAGGEYDREYFTFTVPDRAAFTRLIVLYSTINGGNGQLLALESGTEVTVDPDNMPSPAPLLGYLIIGPGDDGTNVLPALGTAPGAIGFAPPLPSGAYSVWVQDGNLPPSTYGLRFTLAEVPLPDAGLMAAAGLLSLATLRRRRRS